MQKLTEAAPVQGASLAGRAAHVTGYDARANALTAGRHLQRIHPHHPSAPAAAAASGASAARESTAASPSGTA